MTDADGEHQRRGDVVADEQWREVLRLAWRPAWAIRSRKGCLAPFIRWWKERGARGE
jgi:hypothetical protein